MKIFLILLNFFLFGSISLCLAENDEMIFIQYSHSSYNMNLKVYINGVLLAEETQIIGSSRNYLNQWIFDNKNEIIIKPSITDPKSYNIDNTRLEFTIKEYRMKGDTRDESTLCSFNWTYIENKGIQSEIKKEFEVNVPFSEWAYKSAEKLEPKTINLNSLKDYIKTYHSYLTNKDYDKLKPLLKVKNKEMAEAFCRPLDQSEKNQAELFNQLFADNFKMMPINFDNMSLVYHADNKLVQVLNKDGEHFLATEKVDGSQNFFELYLCSIKGKWILCR